MKYKNEEEIKELVGRFETGAITRDEWRHHEHMTVALYYVSTYGRDAALDSMRAGIHSLLRSFGLDPAADDSPYHETLTVFWIDAIDDFLRTRTGVAIHEVDAELAASCDKDFPLRFYSRDLLFSDRARREYLSPDLVQM